MSAHELMRQDDNLELTGSMHGAQALPPETLTGFGATSEPREVTAAIYPKADASRGAELLLAWQRLDRRAAAIQALVRRLVDCHTNMLTVSGG